MRTKVPLNEKKDKRLGIKRAFKTTQGETRYHLSPLIVIFVFLLIRKNV